KKLLATLLVANNLFNIGVVILFSYIGRNIFIDLSSPALKFILEVTLITFLILLFGEVLPKVYATRYNKKFAERVVYPIAFLDAIFSPVSLPMRRVTLYL